MSLNSKRRIAEKKVIRKRLRQLDTKIYDGKNVVPHLFHKKSLGCRRARCKFCHKPKYDDKIKETEV